MEVDSLIPPTLITARDGFEAANRAWIAIREASVAPEAAARHARTRIAELDQEIDELLGAVLADAALADLPDAAGARMSAEAIAEAERRLGELRAERDGPHPMLGAGAAAVRAIQGRITAAAAGVAEAARVFVAENRRFIVGLDAEFAGDVGRLVLPQLFRKWCGIADGLRHVGMLGTLDGLTIATPGGAMVVHKGCYRDPELGQAVDWKVQWKTAPALVALNRKLAELRTAVAGAVAAINLAERQRQQAADAGHRQANVIRQQAYRPAPVTSERVTPATTQLEREARPRPPEPASFTVRTGGAPAPARP